MLAMEEVDTFSYDYYHMKIDNALILDIYESLFRDTSPVRGRFLKSHYKNRLK